MQAEAVRALRYRPPADSIDSAIPGLLVFVLFLIDGEFVEKHHRLVGRDLEAAAAARAGDVIVDAEQMVAQFVVHRLVARVTAGHLRLLRSSHPLDLVVVPMAALRTLQGVLPHFGLLGEEVALVDHNQDDSRIK